jgi:hypothetical protein
MYIVSFYTRIEEYDALNKSTLLLKLLMFEPKLVL